MLVSHVGFVVPSGFLPLPVGNVRDRLTEIYRHLSVLRGLRDRDRLGGKCGRCEFRQLFAGFRSPALAAIGDPMAEDPNCSF